MNRNIHIEDIKDQFTFQLVSILNELEEQLAFVKARIEDLAVELDMLNREPNEEEMEIVDTAAQFNALAKTLKYHVKAELETRKFELN